VPQCSLASHCAFHLHVRQVAIKKVVNAFDDLIDAKRILREVKMLRHFKHENVIGLRDLIPPPEDEPFTDMYVGGPPSTQNGLMSMSRVRR
jgi:serine/threonine protein kinase